MLTLWKPRTLQRLESMFDEFFQDRELGKYFETSFSPDIDIRESKDELLIEAELPGLEKKDIKIVYENGTLKISGEKKVEHEVEDELHHRIERSYGRFQRMIPINEEQVNADQIKAEMTHGVLRIAIPKVKVEAKEGKEIEIHVTE